ncbi:MAG: DUF2726 domain-containing protein [Caldimonas sp.]
MDGYLISAVALACALPIIWWLARRQSVPSVRVEQPTDRLDTLAAWPPEPTRVLRSAERLAFSTLKLALPGYLILAQVPIARFLSVPKRYSYAEWMRRIGSQCVDFVVCDVTTQVVAVVEVRPPAEQLAEKLQQRLARLDRVLAAANVPVHVWNENKLPTIELARERILPQTPAVPPGAAKKAAPQPVATAAVAVAAFAGEEGAPAPAVNPFADTDRDWSNDEIIEVLEPANNTWFDDIDSVSPVLPPPHER